MPITTEVVNSNAVHGKVTCDKSVIFSGYSGFLLQYITEISLKVVLNTINQTWIILISYKLKCLRLRLWFHTDWKSSKLSNVFFVFVCKFSNFLLLHTQYCSISTLKKNTLYMHVHCCEIWNLFVLAWKKISFFFLFRSSCKLILYLQTMYIYILSISSTKLLDWEITSIEYRLYPMYCELKLWHVVNSPFFVYCQLTWW